MATKTAEQKAADKAKREAAKAAKAAAEATGPTMVKITVTEEYLAEHPEINEGRAEEDKVAVGDEIEVEEAPAPVGTEPQAPVKGGTVAKVKKGEGYSILKHGEYIRTYDNKEDAETFCAKNASIGVHAVAESDIVGITVEFDGKNADGSVKQEYKTFTAEEDGADFKAQAIVFKNSHKDAFAKAVLAEE